MADSLHSELRDFLRRLSEWDVLNLAPGSGDDGPYWQSEIRKANAALDALEEQYTELKNDRDGKGFLRDAAEAKMRRLEEELQTFQLWMGSDVARARGLAQSMSELPTSVRLEGIEENAAEIERLLASYPA